MKERKRDPEGSFSPTTDFLIKLVLLKEARRDGTFTIQVGEKERDVFMQTAIELGASFKTCQLPPRVVHEVIEPLTENGEVFKCNECGEPAIFYLNCSCGIHAWCGEHEDNSIIFKHFDHECSPECCARGHRAEIVSLEDLKAAISPIEVSIEEEEVEVAGRASNFRVEVRQKTEKDLLEELEVLMGEYRVKELESLDAKEVVFNKPLSLGVTAVIRPNSLSSRTLALAVLGYDFLIQVKVVEKRSDWEYLCLLPREVILPGHSQPYQGQEGVHCVVLPRSDLVPLGIRFS